jgi:hypothetical protein
MDITIQNINKVVSYTNFVVSKINPYAGVVTSEAAVITQIGTTAVAVVNQTSQAEAEILSIDFSVDASVIALTAKIDGFLLSLGVAATSGSGTMLASGAIFSPGGLMLVLSATAGVVAAAANQSVRDIITDPKFWDSMKNNGLNGLDDYVKTRSGISLSDLLDKLAEGILTGEISKFSHAISDATSTNFNTAATFIQPVRRDPLTLDLDGDGLETVGTAAGILFDTAANGIKVNTGWVKADDGLLVLDKNGNGSIDSGRELFGDATLKRNGQLAADGFDALRDLDSNNNGKLDAGDTQFNNLRVWRDLNQNGSTQNGELFSLGQLSIASINVGSSQNSQRLANGNQIADLGTYTKTNGGTGLTGEVTGNLADINFVQNSFRREFADHPDTLAVAHLPDMREAANDDLYRMTVYGLSKG